MSIFKLSTGKKAEATGSFEMGGNDEPIPDGTKVRAAITDAGWKEYQGSRYINLRYDVVDGEYKKRVIFQKLKVYESDPAKADRQRSMLAAIDANCGGKLQAIDGEPTDIELLKALSNHPIIIRLSVWSMDGKSGNWVSAISSNGAEKKQKPKAEEKPKEAEPTDDPDIDF